MLQSDPWQTKFTNICQDIHNIKHHAKQRNANILRENPSSQNRGKVVSLDTHGVSETDGVHSVYSTPQNTESGHSSGKPEYYNTLISCASLTHLSAPSRPPTPQMPPPSSRNLISELSSDPGLRRACNGDLSQSSSPCENVLGRCHDR